MTEAEKVGGSWLAKGQVLRYVGGELTFDFGFPNLLLHGVISTVLLQNSCHKITFICNLHSLLFKLL